MKVVWALALLILVACGRSKGPEKVEYPVKVQMVEEMDIPVDILSFGTLQPPNTVNIKAQVTGQILQVPFKEGDFVHKGDLLVAIDPSTYLAQLQSARGQLSTAQADLVYAQAAFDSYKILAADDYISVLDMASYERNLLDAKGSVLNALGNLEQAKINLGYTQIVAPVDGVIGFMNYQVGNIANLQDTLVTVTQLQPLNVYFSLSERDLNRVRRVEDATVDATFLDPKEGSVQGRLYAVDNTVDIETGTIALKAQFDNADWRMWPGQFVRLSVHLGKIPNSLVISKTAVLYGQQGSYVWRVSADMTVKSVPVTLGPGTDTLVSVTTGLQKGDRVVTDGQLNLFEGAPVSVK